MIPDERKHVSMCELGLRAKFTVSELNYDDYICIDLIDWPLADIALGSLNIQSLTS